MLKLCGSVSFSYRFSLPKATDTLGLPIGQHIQIQSLIAATGKTLTRSYTPTSSDEDKGHFDLLIKSYELGNISKVVGQMQIGDKLKIKGPKGHFVYRNGLAKHLSMIAGGTGITPMLQIIRAITRDEDDKTTVSLLYANVSESDILLKAELDEAVAQSNGRLKVHYVLNNPPAGWNGGVGFVSKEMIEERCGAALEDESSKMLMCGPPPMLTAMKCVAFSLSFSPSLLLFSYAQQAGSDVLPFAHWSACLQGPPVRPRLPRSPTPLQARGQGLLLLSPSPLPPPSPASASPLSLS